MTSMVQTDLGPSAVAKYKDEPIDSPLRHSSGPQLQSRSASLFHPQKHHSGSPRQLPTTLPSGPYASHSLSNSLSHSTYAPHPQEPYYASHPAYSTASATSQYPSSGPPDLMATTAQLHRPYPPIYHTPQSSSPASVASQTHDPHSRSLYAQSPQMTSHMYGYQPYSSINPVQPSPYATNHSPQPHPLTSQSSMLPLHQSSTAGMPSPGTAAQQQQQQQQPTPPQRTVLNPPSHHQQPPANTSAPVPTSAVHNQGSSGVGTSSSAAPGPIPATTPLVVRQDGNGVQWIAFEYSRERIKMEYTIRCDVESVNVDNLSQEFKTENCVYPRACCNKDQYKGNRLVYETECNAVGWALAELNVSLRGKRGLIQRAVDSWRNSNQDPRLRSRRVRRMAKVNRRQTVSAQPAASHSHMAAAAAGSPITPTAPGLMSAAAAAAAAAASSARPSVGPMSMGPPQLHHHHHAQLDGSSGHEEVSGTTTTSSTTAELTNTSHESSSQGPASTTADIRPAQVFHGYQNFPPSATSSSRGPSMPPPLMGSSLDSAYGRPPAVATSLHQGGGGGGEESGLEGYHEGEGEVDEDTHPSKESLFGTIPEGKRRKFILVDDTQRGSRVRVKVMLDQVDVDEIPDSYRLANSVYPRTYFPVQLKNPPGRSDPGRRFFKDGGYGGGGGDGGGNDDATEGRVTVPAPSLDGESEMTAVPRLSRPRNRKDVMLNDLAYRMSWSQSRVFAGRTLFLQRSLDAYRNKMRGTMLAAGRESSSIPAHFETRAGKRRFLERGRRRNLGHGDASRRNAEEVE